MQKFFRAASIVFFAVAAAVFGLVFFGESTIPDEICVMDGVVPDYGTMFTVNITDSTVSARSGSSQRATAQVRLFGTIPVKSSSVTVVRRQYVIVGGGVFGLRLYTDGVIIVGSESITTDSGSVNPATDAGLREGDSITQVDGKKVGKNSELSQIFENSNGRTLTLTIRRDGEMQQIKFTPALCRESGKYKAGLWVRDSSAGVGTVTFIKKDSGVFGGLGHAVCDVDTGKIMPLLDGDTVETTVRSCTKSSGGSPGELCGVFGAKTTGSLFVNSDSGVYGIFDTVPEKRQTPVALPNEIKEGKAQIVCTVDGNGAKYYDVEITKVSKKSEAERKNMVIKVTDEKLIKLTGGIVQGMSGSPIVQNGMLVGAVTHVFVNDPLQGYGIFAETMLETAGSLDSSIAPENRAA